MEPWNCPAGQLVQLVEVCPLVGVYRPAWQLGQLMPLLYVPALHVVRNLGAGSACDP